MFDLFHLTHKHSGGDGMQIDHGGLSGLDDDDHPQYHNNARGDARYALISKGVTNGDAHDHIGGDGAQIDHGGLAGLSDNDHPQYALTSVQRCRVFNSAIISIPNAAWTELTFDSEQSDQGGMHSILTNTGRITFSAAGFYIFGGSISFVANATGVRFMQISLNATGSGLVESSILNLGASWPASLNCAGGYQFAANDYILCRAYQNSGGALNVYVSLNSPVFWAAKVL